MITELVSSFLVVAVFIVAYYMITGIPPGAELIEEAPPVANTLDTNQSKFMFFYTSWCPYCKNADQPWKSLQQYIKNGNLRYGGKSVTFEEINCESDKGKKSLYNIQAYPTFKLETPNKVYVMVGKPSVSNFRAFLQKALGDEKPFN